MVNWDKYGLGNFQETFDSMGIETEGDLIDLAPYIEDELGLEGLCDAIGVKRPQKVKEPVRTSGGGTGTGTGTSKSSWGLFDVFEGFMVKLFVGLLVVALLFFGGVFAAHYVGLIKNTLFVNLSVSEDSGIVLQDMSVKLIPQRGTKQAILPEVTGEGTMELKAGRGKYDVYLVYDGQEFLYDTWNVSNLYDMTLEIDATNLFQRVVLVRFKDVEGNALYPEQIGVNYSSGENVSCNPLQDDLYVMHIGNQTDGVTITLSVDSYQPVEIVNDWEASRVSLVEVTLHDEK